MIGQTQPNTHIPGSGVGKNLSKSRSTALYVAAQEFINKGDWQAGLSAVDALLKDYPDVQELQQMRADILQHLQPTETNPWRNNAQYRTAIRHIKNSEWTPALALVQGLLASNPADQRLLSLQEQLHTKLSTLQAIKPRRRKLLTLGALSLIFLAISALFYRYIKHPAPLAALIAPNVALNYAPHYLFSIYGPEKPHGIAISQDGERLYVSEMGGSRLIRVFDREGDPQSTIEMPHTAAGERAPVYMATDSQDRLYVADRMQHSVFIFDRQGEYLNALLAPDTTLSEFVSAQTAGQLTGEKFSFNLFKNLVFYQSSAGAEASLELPLIPDWAPLGIRIDKNGTIYLTDVSKDKNTVQIISAIGEISMHSSGAFDPSVKILGTSGQGDGQFLFPNAVVADSQGRIYVSDGNNARISVWDSQGNFLFNFGRGVGEAALSLPRGMFIDQHDRLFVVDAVGQNVKVYDVSAPEPAFLFAFGEFGMEDGMFNYPNDIAVDDLGRIYIVDRENNRIQVWSF